MCSLYSHSKNSTVNDYGLIVRNRNSDSKRKIQKYCYYDLTTSGKCEYVFDSLDAVVQHRVMKSRLVQFAPKAEQGRAIALKLCFELDCGTTVGAYDAVC